MFSWTEMTIFIILFYFKTMSMLDIQTIAWIEMVCTNLRRFITFFKRFFHCNVPFSQDCKRTIWPMLVSA